MRKVYNLSGVRDVNVTNILKDEQGRQIVSPTIEEAGGLLNQVYSDKCHVFPNTVNIFDSMIEDDMRIAGGEFWVCEAGLDYVGDNDYVEFSIIDKDDTLGLFPLYGLTVGEDIIELGKFVRHEYVKKGSKACGYYSDLVSNMVGTSLCPAGLYRRVYYFAEDLSQEIDIIAKYYYFV